MSDQEQDIRISHGLSTNTIDIDIEKLVKALAIDPKDQLFIDPKDLEELRKALDNASEFNAPEIKEDQTSKQDSYRASPGLSRQDINRELAKIQPKCTCGVNKTYSNPTMAMHSTWCDLRSK